MAKRVWLITGAPGTGKTTLLLKIVGALENRGVSVGGMVSREVRENGVRVGFEILDLTSSKQGWLAHVNQKVGPQVGKYRVNLQDLDHIGATAIKEATIKAAVVAIDEIGPMELYSEKFKHAVTQALESHRVVLAVVHVHAQDPLIVAAKQRPDAELVQVTAANRGDLVEVLTGQVLTALDFNGLCSHK
ncbi:MAG: NTPase [Candidatus Bathyarchaeota archaeon]|nr:NTPase [Candidatus Bathyarchaeota archaeon]